jgi:hypothetical protein
MREKLQKGLPSSQPRQAKRGKVVRSEVRAKGNDEAKASNQ